MVPGLQLLVFGASLNAVKGSCPLQRVVGAGGEAGFTVPGSPPHPPAFAALHLGCARAGRPLSAGLVAAASRLAGLGLWSREEPVIRKKCSWLFFFFFSFSQGYLGYSTSAWREQREAFVVRTRDFFLSFSYFLFLPSPFRAKATAFLLKTNVSIRIEEKVVCKSGMFGFYVDTRWALSLPCFLSLASSE